MSPLLSLFREKLETTLPGAIVVEGAGDDASDASVISLCYAYEEGPSLNVALPADRYGSWQREHLEILLAELLENCELTLALDHQHARYEAYLREVKTVKEKLLPGSNHAIEGLDYAVHYSPTVGGGGDYFDIVDLRGARRRAGDDSPGIFWGSSLFDVSGHGPGSAVEVAMIDAILRTYQGGPGTGPGSVMTYLNRHFFTRQLRGGFVTGLICNYHAPEQTLSWANAGHLPLILKKANGSMEILEDHSGIPIGVERHQQWDSGEIRMESGDSIIMMTDGITEARSHDNRQFGFEAVTEFVDSASLENPKTFLDAFRETFNSHTAGLGAQDDETLLVMKLSH